MNYTPLHLDSDEHVILEVRKHWIIFVGHAVGVLFSAILPFVVLSVLVFFVPGIPDVGISYSVSMTFIFLYCLWLLILWISFFTNWTKYYLDVWYVTEKRIIIVEQKRIFDREISNVRFDKIEDVTIDVHGLIPTFLNFGNVRVQTASEDNLDFIISTVRNPDEVRRIIFNQHNEIGDTGKK